VCNAVDGERDEEVLVVMEVEPLCLLLDWYWLLGWHASRTAPDGAATYLYLV
jgi:hypothetical protein